MRRPASDRQDSKLLWLVLDDWQLPMDASILASPVDAMDGALQSEASEAEGADAAE